MNGQQQRQHKTAIDALASDTQTLMAGVVRTFNVSLAKEESARKTAVNEMRVYIDARDALLLSTLRDFQAMGFWRRVKWLVTGKLV